MTKQKHHRKVSEDSLIHYNIQPFFINQSNKSAQTLSHTQTHKPITSTRLNHTHPYIKHYIKQQHQYTTIHFLSPSPSTIFICCGI
jgi:hypothetical protein